MMKCNNTNIDEATGAFMDFKLQLQQLSTINDNGIELLNAGDFEPAISAFGRALNMARNFKPTPPPPPPAASQSMASQQQEEEPTTLTALCFDHCMDHHHHHQGTSTTTPTSNQEHSSVSVALNVAGTKQQHQDGVFMYRQPLHILCDGGASSKSSPSTSPPSPCCYCDANANAAINGEAVAESYLFVTVVLIFNTALAYQLAAHQLRQESLNNSLFVKKSIQLYRLTYRLYQEETLFDASPYFCMAIVNNLGLLYRESHCWDKAEQCFQHLLSTLMFLVDCNKEENICSSSSITTEEFQGYFANTAYLIFEKLYPVAPAA
eukprot:scaffold4004_cov105-Cylindrotheca_fusiformis.AAC.10